MKTTFKNKTEAMGHGFTPCGSNKVIARIGKNTALVCRDEDAIAGRNQFGYSFGLYKRVKIEHPDISGEYIYEYSERLLDSVDVWLSETPCQTGALGAVAVMFPPQPLTFLLDCAKSLTFSERAYILAGKSRMNLSQIAAETGTEYKEILAYCNRRWPRADNPHLDGDAWVAEIYDVLSNSYKLREYHPDLFDC